MSPWAGQRGIDKCRCLISRGSRVPLVVAPAGADLSREGLCSGESPAEAARIALGLWGQGRGPGGEHLFLRSTQLTPIALSSNRKAKEKGFPCYVRQSLKLDWERKVRGATGVRVPLALYSCPRFFSVVGPEKGRGG